MALFHCNFHSNVLGIAASMDVILPQRPGSGGRFQTLYLLHGMSDDHTIWQRRTAIEHYVAGRDLAVVMPAVNRSYYTDMAQGSRYFTFVSEELPALARSFFPLSDQREDNFVVGLSMGGYGAFKVALHCPDRYVAAASLSGVLDIASRVKETAEEDRIAEYARTFGDPATIAGSRHDLMHLASGLARSQTPIPALYQWCGVEDSLYKGNITFRDHVKALGIPLDYSEGPGGHTWDRWDDQIARVLDWLPLREN
ncbi:MAG: esterase family protein [Gemmatimonadetes bacterium]|jgi:putative tributyrin esterase|nr:esterase family protein [Gemmatimonadota bacterium]MBT7862036.1 esterase family protein [Gemmatimonadota bacterium]